jgi:hypothetical protein
VRDERLRRLDALVLLVIGFVNLLTTLMLGVRERERDFGVFKVVGVIPRQLFETGTAGGVPLAVGAIAICTSIGGLSGAAHAAHEPQLEPGHRHRAALVVDRADCPRRGAAERAAGAACRSGAAGGVAAGRVRMAAVPHRRARLRRLTLEPCR